MKSDFTSLLRCPMTGTELNLEPFENDPEHQEEIFSGVLRCEHEGTVYEYPIIGGVPRMLPVGERGELGSRYTDYFERFREKLGEHLLDECAGLVEQNAVQIDIMDRFGYEWTEFADYNSDNFLYWIDPLTPEFFSGKLGLDIGCGAGRHSAEAVRYGAQMVAMDLSWSVDSAYQHARTRADMHVVQASVFHAPFSTETFDFMYSLGVLHHTPDPPKAFACAVPLVRPEGAVFVMIYSSQRKWIIALLALARAVTTRLPNSVIKFLSYTGGSLDMLFLVPYRILRFIGMGKLAQALFPTRVRNYADFSFHDLVTDWFDRLSYPEVHYYSDEEITSWYRNAGCEKILVTPLLNHAYRGLGYREAAK